MLPSASPTANSSFQTTYDGLLTKLATARDEMAQALISQSKQVRTDQGLLGVVGQLRSRGTWALNSDGMESTSRQAFVIETYKALCRPSMTATGSKTAPTTARAGTAAARRRGRA